MTTRQSSLGKIEISANAIATLSVETVLECYGVVGLTGKTKFDDWRKGLLHGVSSQRGVDVTINDDVIVVDLYIIIEYGTRISEVARSVMHRLQYTLEQTMGLPIAAVNVHVQDLRVSESDKHIP